MKILENIWAWLVWFRYESPVRNFGSDCLDYLRCGVTNGIAILRGNPIATLNGGSVFWGLNVQCWILGNVIDFLEWITPRPRL